MTAAVLPVASRALLDACRHLGLDAHRLLGEAGIDPAGLEDPDARLPTSQADALWAAALRASGSPALPLRAAAATPFGAFRVLDYLGATGPSLGDGLRLVAGYFPLVDPRGRLAVEEGPDRLALVFTAASGEPLPRPAQEYTLAVIFDRARHALAGDLRLAEVRFAFPPPADAGEHQRTFGVMPRFGQRAAALVFTRGDWQRATVMTDPGLFQLLGAHAGRLAREQDSSGGLVDRARDNLTAARPGRAPTLASTAAALSVSRRTLQRRLAGAGTTFAALLAEVRRARAETCLRALDVSIAEVSWLLGFSEQSAFTRAFHRWTGRSPSRYREQAAARDGRLRAAGKPQRNGRR